MMSTNVVKTSMDSENHVENVNTSEKAQKTQKMQNFSVLECFSKITSENQKVRVKSGAVLIKQLALEENPEKELDYSLQRIIRSLGASKESTRVGSYSTLTVMLQSIDCDVRNILTLIEKELNYSKKNSKSENGDILLGHILACAALINSGILKKTANENIAKIFELLQFASSKKVYYRKLAYSLMVQSFENLERSIFKSSVLPAIKVEISKPISEYNIDTLYLVLKANEHFSKIIKNAIQKEVICTESIPNIVKFLMDRNILRNNIDELSYMYIATKIAQSPLLGSFIEEMNVNLVKPSITQLSIATMLLTTIIEKIENKTLLSEVIPNNYIIEIVSYLQKINSKRQDELQTNIYKLFTCLVTALKSDDVKEKQKIVLMKKLLFYPGTFIFEKLTRSRVLQQITNTLSNEGVKKLCKIYRKILLGENEKQKEDNITEPWTFLDKVYAAQLIGKLISHPAVKTDIDWKVGQLIFFVDVALLHSEKRNILPKLAAKFRETLFRSLDIETKPEELVVILYRLVTYIDGHLEESKYESVMQIPFDNTSFTLWKKSINLINKIEQDKSNRLNPVFQTLFMHMSLQLFNDLKLATDSLNELFSCYNSSKKTTKNENDIEWIEVVIDLFLNLLSHNSHLLRSLIKTIFKSLCKDLTANAMNQIISVLDPKNEDNPLSEDFYSDAESEIDESEIDSESEADEVDNETVNDKLRQAVRSALGNNGAITDEESVDLDELSESECNKLDTALSVAFKQFKPNAGKKTKKQNKESETLTHFRVRVLDLVEVYLDSDVSMILCLEIIPPLLQALEFTIRDEKQKPFEVRLKVCLRKLSNIKKFNSIEGVDDQILCDLFKSLMDRGQKNLIALQEMSDEFSESCIFVINCAEFICNSKETNKSTRKKIKKGVNAILMETVKDYFEKRDCLTPIVFFKSIFSLVYAEGVNLIPAIVSYAFNNEVRPFRRNQALELIKLFYTNQRNLISNQEGFKDILIVAEKSIYEETVALFESEEITVKEKFICGVFNLLTAISKSPIKTQSIDWDRIKVILPEFRSGISLSKDNKSAFNRLCGFLKISNNVTLKSNVIKLGKTSVEDEDNTEETQKTKKHKNKNKDSRKEKKNAHMLRLESLSEGLIDNVEFNKMDTTNESMEDEVEESPKTNGVHKRSKRESKKGNKKIKIK